MIFNSLTFLVFIPIVFGLYWFGCGRSVRLQNTLLVVASYVFYGWLDWRFCGLLALSTGSAWLCGRMIDKAQGGGGTGKAWMQLGVTFNLSVLGFFKYYNFFAESVSMVCSGLGFSLDIPTLRLVLPIGISFYSFMVISYVVDVYRRTVVVSRNSFAFVAAISFFPQLLAGPIGRMSQMLPQFEQRREFDYELAVDGCRQMLWGFFKKIVIADGCATLTDRLFLEPSIFSGSVLAVGVFMYAVQIYADFSGYSDIAIGCGKLFGIKMMRNFAFPYFATNIADFWRRWHISLTTWFRDYVYIPLGGSRCSRMAHVRNIFIVFALSGLWHGANWTFVAWGVLHACFFLPLLLVRRDGKCSTVYTCIMWCFTMTAVMLAWVLFRSRSIYAAFEYFAAMFSPTLLSWPMQCRSMLPIAFACMAFEWFRRHNEHALAIAHWPKLIRWSIYIVISITCIACDQRTGEFIYFQF